MPPKKKQGPSKKAVQAKKTQKIEDATFGLKNKSKSKKVQSYVKQVTTQVENTVGRSKGAPAPGASAAAKKAAKELKQKKEDELKALFGAALEAGPKKGGIGKGKGMEAVAVDKAPKQEQQTIILAEEEKTLEDLIEEQREKLRQEGKVGTPVTNESLAKWKADRAEKKRRAEKELVEKEIKKKGKAKGLNVLSGRALFDYDATLFKDDDDAVDNSTMAERQEATDEDGGDETKKLSEQVNTSLFVDDVDEDLDDLDDDDDD
ncbi:unnamed protein product [Chrysoparadoxa australica]